MYRLSDEVALIQTVDFFTPVVDDPFAFGQITAANALSDVYAMGGRPLLAMNILACPPEKEMDRAVIRQVVEGGLSKVKEAGALLVGGHSIEDSELKFGLSVTGVVHPQHVLLNSGARAGDLLVLTKPIGTGILSTALKGGLAAPGIEATIIEVMATLNRQAAEIMTGGDLEVHGCTDITGFGLIGHLHEMAVASGLAVRLRAAAVPVLGGVLDFAAMGIIPAGAHTNRSFYKEKVECRLPAGSPLEMALYDPQTSGGLLVSLAAAKAELFIARLRQTGYPLRVAAIGEMVAGEAGYIEVLP